MLPPRRRTSLIAALLLCSLCLLLASCKTRDRFINVSISNTGSQPIHDVEVQYPSASFGTTNIAPGATFHYKFKPTGDGNLQLNFVQADGKQHHEQGPAVHPGDSGDISLTIDGQANNTWDTKLKDSRQRD